LDEASIFLYLIFLGVVFLKVDWFKQTLILTKRWIH